MDSSVGLLTAIEDILNDPPPMPAITDLTQNTWVAIVIFALVEERKPHRLLDVLTHV